MAGSWDSSPLGPDTTPHNGGGFVFMFSPLGTREKLGFSHSCCMLLHE